MLVALVLVADVAERERRIYFASWLAPNRERVAARRKVPIIVDGHSARQPAPPALLGKKLVYCEIICLPIFVSNHSYVSQFGRLSFGLISSLEYPFMLHRILLRRGSWRILAG
jgi:hypothetical protein